MRYVPCITAAVILGIGAGCDTRRPGTETSVSRPAPSLAAAPSDCLTEFREGVDYFPHKTDLRAARGFAVSYHQFYKLLSTAARRQDKLWADTVVLLQCGAPHEKLPRAVAHLPVISIPVRTAGFNDHIDFARMSRLPAAPALQLVVGPRVGEQVRAVVFISTRNIDPEVAMQQARAGRLAAVATQTWAEGSPLARTEWIKQHAPFINGEADAAAHFDSIASNYAAIVHNIGKEAKFARVFWGGRNESGQWHMHNSNLESRLIADAGGLNVLWQESPARIVHLSDGQLLRRAAIIDVWINGGVPANQVPAGLRTPMRAVQRARVYRAVLDPATGVPLWYAAASVQPTAVLAELVKLFHEPAATIKYKFFAPELVTDS